MYSLSLHEFRAREYVQYICFYRCFEMYELVTVLFLCKRGQREGGELRKRFSLPVQKTFRGK